ncbi:hypothetical protein J3A83DRAFT_4189013 [Scleroderma citrinum]
MTTAAVIPESIPNGVSNDNSTPQASEPPLLTVSKKRGQSSKKMQPAAVKEDPEEPPKPSSVMYYLAIFSEVEMKKSEKQCKPSNMFLQMKSDLMWDTIQAQLLEKISMTTTLHGMQLQTDADHKFLITHALKPKEPAVNIKIEVKPAKNGKMKPKDDPEAKDDTDESLDSNQGSDTSGDMRHVKKKSKLL